jgi:hypothetical protein
MILSDDVQGGARFRANGITNQHAALSCGSRGRCGTQVLMSQGLRHEQIFEGFEGSPDQGISRVPPHTIGGSIVWPIRQISFLSARSALGNLCPSHESAIPTVALHPLSGCATLEMIHRKNLLGMENL